MERTRLSRLDVSTSAYVIPLFGVDFCQPWNRTSSEFVTREKTGKINLNRREKTPLNTQCSVLFVNHNVMKFEGACMLFCPGDAEYCKDEINRHRNSSNPIRLSDRAYTKRHKSVCFSTKSPIYSRKLVGCHKSLYSNPYVKPQIKRTQNDL